jgi:flagellar protein FliS
MATSSHPFSPQASAGSEQYLDATIRTASPARLRMMIIERGVRATQTLATLWRDGQSLGSNEHSLKLLDVLSELLNGVTAGASPAESVLCSQVADLYVFLIQHLVAAESHSDASAVDEIRLVLEAESETWRMVCAGELAGGGHCDLGPPPESATMSINFEA